MDDRDALHELHHAEQLKLQQLEEAPDADAIRTSRGVAHSTKSKDTNMPKLSEMMPSKYLKKEDLDEHDGELLVTVKKIAHRNVAKDGDPEEMKWLCKFAELDKPMIMNSTNLQLMAKALASEDSDDWIGGKVMLYNDPGIQFQGRVVGGLRIKAAPKKKAAPARDPGDDDDEPVARKPSRAAVEDDDDIPF